MLKVGFEWFVVDKYVFGDNVDVGVLGENV